MYSRKLFLLGIVLLVLSVGAFLLGNVSQSSLAACLTPSSTPTVTGSPNLSLLSLTPSPTRQISATPIPLLVNSPPPSPTMVISMGDLHMHTTCSDGSSTYELMVKRAMKLGYAFIAITDHHFADTTTCRQVIESCRNEKRILCIPSMEVSGKRHLLAVGISKSIDKGLSIKAQVEAIHKQGGLAIAAHPYAIPPYSEDELFRSGLDGAECSAVPPAERAHFLEMQQKYPIHCVFNSDAHNFFQMQTFNICSGKIATFADLKNAILQNRCW